MITIAIIIAVFLLALLASVILLAVGTLLARVFPVSAFEATAVVTAVTVVITWLLVTGLTRIGTGDEELEPGDLPIISVPPPPIPGRSGKRRRR